MIPYLTANELKILLEQPDIYTIEGRRDLMLLVVLYDTGARVQELIDSRWILHLHKNSDSLVFCFDYLLQTNVIAQKEYGLVQLTYRSKCIPCHSAYSG